MAVSLNRLCDQSCLGSPAMRQPYGRLTPPAARAAGVPRTTLYRDVRRLLRRSRAAGLEDDL